MTPIRQKYTDIPLYKTWKYYDMNYTCCMYIKGHQNTNKILKLTHCWWKNKSFFAKFQQFNLFYHFSNIAFVHSICCAVPPLFLLCCSSLISVVLFLPYFCCTVPPLFLLCCSSLISIVLFLPYFCCAVPPLFLLCCSSLISV